MKITIEVGQDAELRREILKIISDHVRRITGDEIKKMVSGYLSQVDIAAKVSGALKQTVNWHIEQAVRGYGNTMVKQVLDTRLKDWLETKGVIANEVAEAVKDLAARAVGSRLKEKLKGIVDEEFKLEK